MGSIQVVIGDVHARTGTLVSLLRSLGAIDSRGRRREGWWIIQVGDLLDRHASPDANLRAAQTATRLLDVVLAGNHEATLLAERAGDHGAALATLAARGWPHAATSVGDWLVTHAGVHPHDASTLSPCPVECAEQINDRWHRRVPARAFDPLFDWVGPARGGPAPWGGILWMGEHEWPIDATTPWGQITGHAPQAMPRLLGGPRWAIDVGARSGRLAALVRRGARAEWQPLLMDPALGGAARRRAFPLAA